MGYYLLHLSMCSTINLQSNKISDFYTVYRSPEKMKINLKKGIPPLVIDLSTFDTFISIQECSFKLDKSARFIINILKAS